MIQRKNSDHLVRFFFIPEEFSPERLSDALRQKYEFSFEDTHEEYVIFQDSFDWRLWKDGKILLKKTNNFHLLNAQDGIAHSNLETDRVTGCNFWWNFPASPLQDYLKSKLDIRALFDRLAFTLQTNRYKLLNEDQKTVLQFYQHKAIIDIPENQETALYFFEFEALRGYENEMKQVEQILLPLSSKGRNHWDFYLKLFIRLGLAPGDYSSKQQYSFTADYTTRQASREILQDLTGILMDNELGIIRDIDTEFLHDFRVAVRRMRTLLNECKNALDRDRIQKYRKTFSDIQTRTGTLRDMDVYLMEKNSIAGKLPSNLQEHLQPFFEYLQEKRHKEWKKFVTYLKGKTYLNFITSWRSFLKEELAVIPPSSASEEQVKKFANRHIRKRYKNIRTWGLEIKKDSPDEKYHALRKECKKLRYLLEFFRHLYPEKKISQYIKSLKKFQDKLGLFNDRSVQQSYLKEYLHLEDARESRSPVTYSAIGALMEALYIEQQEVKNNFHKSFTTFIKPGKEELFHKLFYSE